MESKHFIKAALLSLILVLVFIVAWEVHWRHKGYITNFDDAPPLWAHKRAMVYAPQDAATVFIGSSRIKFDLDIPLFEKLTGEKAVMLATVGSSARPFLYDLAADENFKGKLVIDITEPLFFSMAPARMSTPQRCLDYYSKESPTQRFSFKVSCQLENRLVFLNMDYLSTNALLSQVDLPRRKDVFMMPYFPPGFDNTDFNRQSHMTPAFANDTNQHVQMQNVWLKLINLGKALPPPSPVAMDSIFQTVTTAVEKIRSRGGKVLFVRTPSSGPMGAGEQMAFAREKYWERLLTETGTPGIHYLDYKETANFQCPEWSHLHPKDVPVYTRHLVQQMQNKGWQFAATANKTKPIAYR